MSGIEPSENDRPGFEPSGPSAGRPSAAKPISLADLIAFNEEVAALAVELAGEWQPDEQSDFEWLMRRSEITWPRGK